MQKFRIIVLYFMLILFSAIAVFCVYQMCFSSDEPMPAITQEDPYPYEEPSASTVTSVPTEEISLSLKLDYDADALLNENADFIGWLMIPDTSVSFPVVQGTDNQFYLKHSFHKEYSRYGCPFLDTRTPAEGECRVIHGHNMGNNRTEMFSPLANYQNESFAESHQNVLFSLPGSDDPEIYRLFAVVNQQIDQGFEYIVSDFPSEESRNAYIDHLQKNSLFSSDFIPEGKLLILSTCNNTYGTNNRLLICLGAM